MTTHRMPDFSRRLYGGLLKLYPREFREEFGASMLQLFSDQCRYAARENGARGMAFLWLRTLGDLFASLIREHLVSPRASLGLFEAVPNRPLPWKGVALVTIPGIVFLAGQIAQLAGEDLFFLLVRRAAYFLIAPVLIVWIARRKFPLWGLIPLAMFYRTVIDAANRLKYIFDNSLSALFISPASWTAVLYKKVPAILKALSQMRRFLMENADSIKIAVIVLLLAGIVLFLHQAARRSRITRGAGILLGAFLVVALTRSFSGLVSYLTDYRWTIPQLLASSTLGAAVMDMLYSAYANFTYDFGFLLLILAGMIASWRHGRLALLLPLGYLVPEVLLGRFDYDERFPYLLVAAGAAVLVYRIFVTVIAPVWIVRSASDRDQYRAGAIGLLAAVGFIAAVQTVYLFVVGATLGWEISMKTVYYTISTPLLTLAGMGLALSLYKKDADSPEASTPQPASILTGPA